MMPFGIDYPFTWHSICAASWPISARRFWPSANGSPLIVPSPHAWKEESVGDVLLLVSRCCSTRAGFPPTLEHVAIPLHRAWTNGGRKDPATPHVRRRAVAVPTVLTSARTRVESMRSVFLLVGHPYSATPGHSSHDASKPATMFRGACVRGATLQKHRGFPHRPLRVSLPVPRNLHL